MPAIVQRCLQCGSPSACEAERVPPYGARLRCPECGNLLPLVVPPNAGAARDGEAPPEAAAALAAEALREGAPEGEGGSRAAARRILDQWVEQVRRAGRSADEHREDLERLRELWHASYPGWESAQVFEEERRAALARLAAETERT